MWDKLEDVPSGTNVVLITDPFDNHPSVFVEVLQGAIDDVVIFTHKNVDEIPNIIKVDSKLCSICNCSINQEEYTVKMQYKHLEQGIYETVCQHCVNVLSQQMVDTKDITGFEVEVKRG